MKTELCIRLGIEVPIICAPMGPAITTPELAAAVSNAGGLGILSFGALAPSALRELIHRMHGLTDKPFGVNFILQFPVSEQVAVCIDERVPVLSFFWGDVAPYVEPARRAGLAVIDQVGSVTAACHSAQAGVDVVIAQGVEAGGHVIGQVSTMALVPCVVDAIAPVPVAAAGGIAGPRGLLAALALGAQGIVMGTRFLAAIESAAHPVYKQRVVAASADDTIHTTLFGRDWDAPHRALRTKFVDEWLTKPRAAFDETPIGETEFGGQRVAVLRRTSLPPTSATSGDIESMALLAGQSVGQIRDLPTAATIVAECIEGARRLMTDLTTTVIGGAGPG